MKGVSIMNSLSTKKFQLLLSHLVFSTNGDAFTSEELIKLRDSLKISDENLMLLVNSIKYLIKQYARVILKPTTLKKELKEHLKLDEEKCDVFVKIWCEETNKDMGKIDDVMNLDDLAWEQNIKIADQVSSEQEMPVTRLQLNLSSTNNIDKNERIVIELDKDELLQLYNALEVIQIKLDNFNA